jgi:hypothetical protein
MEPSSWLAASVRIDAAESACFGGRRQEYEGAQLACGAMAPVYGSIIVEARDSIE